MHRGLVALTLVPLLAPGCDNAGAGAREEPAPMVAPSTASTCEVMAGDMTLPAEIPEASGQARSARDADLFWTHNDAGNEPVLFGVSAAGALVQRVRVTGAALVDWEDIEIARCGSDSCLHIGDIGDNNGARESITVYRVVEPADGVTQTQQAEALHARYPDGPRDAEALFADASGTLYVVTKGRRSAIALYRWPASDTPGQVVTLEHIRDIFPRPQNGQDFVTAATATPNGRWVGIRTYRALYLYPSDPLLSGGEVSPAIVDLSGLGHVQGESLVLADDGTAWLSSEAAGGRRARWSRLKCALPGS